MFMQRLITSLILIPLVLLILFYGPTWLLMGLVVLVLLSAGRECWQLIPLTNLTMQLSFLGLLLLGLWACGELFNLWLTLGLVLWLGIFCAILSFPKSQAYWGHAPIVAIASLTVLPLFLQSLIHLYFLPQGKALILYLLCLVWAADIGAYLAGKRCGKHKLIPQVSPGKSWEGAMGGLVLVFIVALAGLTYFKPPSWVSWFALAIIIAIISIFGDLFVSILKRRCNLKDTGALIPGHGGILDRLDSLIAALPFFYFGINIF
ncbi:phosphatidate cytidylyltransferase [Legionella sp. km772]|uniref:phosphatidate cytidylyltransferase n=1 Tax=Legionella sp. km772 TaxID=2498111 RepID=UPI000F8F3A35|nr:phosphatidate cytidylyltransferase [Legionella sp. km772]RUR13647.1 CDP-archaeol synthase [Legionella sp. km772]